MYFQVRLERVGRWSGGGVYSMVPEMTLFVTLVQVMGLLLKIKMGSLRWEGAPITSMVVVALMSPVNAKVLPWREAVRSR